MAAPGLEAGRTVQKNQKSFIGLAPMVYNFLPHLARRLQSTSHIQITMKTSLKLIALLLAAGFPCVAFAQFAGVPDSRHLRRGNRRRTLHRRVRRTHAHQGLLPPGPEPDDHRAGRGAAGRLLRVLRRSPRRLTPSVRASSHQPWSSRIPRPASSSPTTSPTSSRPCASCSRPRATRSKPSSPPPPSSKAVEVARLRARAHRPQLHPRHHVSGQEGLELLAEAPGRSTPACRSS